LCLDDLTEFARNVQEMIRQPPGERVTTIAGYQILFMDPYDFVLLEAMRPCPADIN
jgi:hypothetical protein